MDWCANIEYVTWIKSFLSWTILFDEPKKAVGNVWKLPVIFVIRRTPLQINP